MLGQEIVRVLQSKNVSVVAWDRDDIDVTDFATLEGRIRSEHPSIIYNCVGYNAVDQAESSDEEYQKALLLNRDVPGELARIAATLDIPLVHYSTDYVFSGVRPDESFAGYTEDAATGPVSRYGESKLLGESAIAATSAKAYVVRLSRLFGQPAGSIVGKRSFFDIMTTLADEGKSIQAVSDEWGNFTYAPDLAAASADLWLSGYESGIYHLANSGVASWYDAAVALFALQGRSVAVGQVSGASFNRPAKRPDYSPLINTKYPPLRDYTEALREFLKK